MIHLFYSLSAIGDFGSEFIFKNLKSFSILFKICYISLKYCYLVIAYMSHYMVQK